MPLRVQIKPILVAAVVLLLLIVGTVFAARASAYSITLHNKCGSDRMVVAKDSGGRMHYLSLCETESMGSSMRIYVDSGTYMKYGDPITGTPFGRTYGPSSWVASKSLWVDVVG